MITSELWKYFLIYVWHILQYAGYCLLLSIYDLLLLLLRRKVQDILVALKCLVIIYLWGHFEQERDHLVECLTGPAPPGVSRVSGHPLLQLLSDRFLYILPIGAPTTSKFSLRTPTAFETWRRLCLI